MKRFGVGLAALLGLVTISANAAPPLSSFGQLPSFEMAAISATGGHYAIIARVDGSRRLLIFDAAKKLVTAAPLGDVNVRWIKWAGDQAVLVNYSAVVALGAGFNIPKAELSSVVVMPIDGTKSWTIFAGHSDITGGVWDTYGVQQHDGRWYGYFGGLTLEKTGIAPDGHLPLGRVQPDLYQVDLQTRAVRQLASRASSDGLDRHWLLDGTGAVAATLDFLRSSGYWAIYNNRHALLVSGIDPMGRVKLDGFSPDGTSVIYRQGEGGDTRIQLSSVPLAGGSPQLFLDPDKVADIVVDRGHRLTGYIDVGAAAGGHFFDATRDKVYKATVAAFPGEHVDLMDGNDGFDQLLVRSSGPGDPGTWWHVDIHSGQADVIGTSYPIAAGDVGPMRMVAYAAADGTRMEGVLTLPPGGAAKNLPAVILPHHRGVYDFVSFDWMAQAFASRGYAVFQPNFRGSAGYGAAFLRAGDGEWGRKMQTDISDGLAALVRQGAVDPKRVCIVGRGYGGYAALAGVTLQQGLYRCAVSIAGFSDLKRVIEKLASAGSDPIKLRNVKRELGWAQDLNAVSPVHFADRASAPILLIHPKDDDQSTAMLDALRHAGKTIQHVQLQEEDDQLSKSETRLAVLQASVDFVVRYNPPDAGR